MKSTLQVLLCLLLSIATAKATSLKGYVYDQKTGEALVGASVYLEHTDKAVLTGLDGSFEIKHPPAGTFTLKVSYVMYKTLTKQITVLKEDNPALKIFLSETKSSELSEVVIAGKNDGSAEKTARRIEQQSPQLLNVVSGRQLKFLLTSPLPMSFSAFQVYRLKGAAMVTGSMPFFGVWTNVTITHW